MPKPEEVYYARAGRAAIAASLKLIGLRHSRGAVHRYMRPQTPGDIARKRSNLRSIERLDKPIRFVFADEKINDGSWQGTHI